MNKQITVSNAFVAHAARLTEKGATPGDIKSILRFATEGNCEFVAGALDGQTVASMHNQKAIKRLAQAIAFCAGDLVAGFDKATALIVASIALSKQNIINFSTMRFAMGGTGDENTVHIKGVSRARLSKFVGTISNEGTRVSQCSRTVGTGGFFAALGIVKSIDKHSFEIVNRNHPLLVAYAMRLENMGDGTFALLTEEKK